MFLISLGLLFLSSLAEESSSLELTPIEDALWRGELRLEVNGSQFTQYLANEIKDRKPVGFTKEKGTLELNYELVIRFTINALGEHSLVADDEVEGTYLLNRETRTTFKKEIFLKKQRTSYTENVQISETALTRVDLANDREFDQEAFVFGSLRFLPSGRMDRRGQVQIIGDLKVPFTSSGEKTFTRERQPPSEKDPNTRQVADVTKTIILPLTFDFTVSHRKDPVSGTFEVTVDASSPFPREEAEDASKRIFRNLLEGSGSFTMTPLFSDKKKP